MDSEFTCEISFPGHSNIYMQDSKRVSGSDPERGQSVQIDVPSSPVEPDPFSDPSVNNQILADVSRVGSAWLEWNAEPREGSFDDKITEALVGTLDAHANALLRAVKRHALVPEYMKHLRRVGALLIENAMKNSVLKDPYAADAPLSAESLRKEVDLALIRLGHARPGVLSGDSQVSSERANRIVEHRAHVATVAGQMELHKQAKKWHEWRDQIVNRIEARFEARYRHWQAEAIERVLRAGSPAEPKRRDPAGVSKWEDVKIEFLSDDRVQIWTGDKPETWNYADMGFMDKRTEKPNESWIILRKLAQQGGTLADSAGTQKNWPAVEKHIQRIRKALREHFPLAGDPIPFVPRVGYRTRFKIRCAASFET